MGTYTQILYQIVFSTKYRKKCMLKSTRQQVFAYMAGIIKNHKCQPFIVNGVATLRDGFRSLWELVFILTFIMTLKGSDTLCLGLRPRHNEKRRPQP
jgi:hypothetical protein